jgi:hypothetical protein
MVCLGYGVGILMSPSASKSFITANAINEAVMMANFQLASQRLTLVAAYATTNDYQASKKEKLNEELQIAAKRVPMRDINGGDFNSHVGAENPQDWQGVLGVHAQKGKGSKQMTTPIECWTFVLQIS